MNKKLVGSALILMLATMACGLPSVPGISPMVSGGTQPTAVAPSNQQGVLFQDDFSNPDSGWDHSSDDNGSTDYENGGYRIHVLTANFEQWANPSKVFQDDVRIEVDATKIGGPENNDFGVMCRYQDTDNYYQLIISSDGYAAVVKEQNGKAAVISSADGKLQPASGIISGGSTNHIRADCIGSTLTLYANGNQVATATDDSFSGGDVGLSAGTYETGGTDVQFDNFAVYAP